MSECKHDPKVVECSQCHHEICDACYEHVIMNTAGKCPKCSKIEWEVFHKTWNPENLVDVFYTGVPTALFELLVLVGKHQNARVFLRFLRLLLFPENTVDFTHKKDFMLTSEQARTLLEHPDLIAKYNQNEFRHIVTSACLATWELSPSIAPECLLFRNKRSGNPRVLLTRVQCLRYALFHYDMVKPVCFCDQAKISIDRFLALARR